jgi:anti-sigma regulatory factor (Ser/Thr protein kinase)
MTTHPWLPPPPKQGTAFVHPAFFYGSRAEYVDGVGGFVRAAAAHGRPVLIAVPAPRLRLLREALGGGHEGLTWIDMREAGRNPGRILSLLQEFADRHGARGPAIVGEPIWVGRTPAEIREATRHEALINLAFAGRHATVLCPYDTALPGPALADARRTHPLLGDAAGHRPSPDHVGPDAVCRSCDTPLPGPDRPRVLDFGEHDLARVRDAARAWAEAVGLPPRRRTDWLLAVGEATGNSVRHGGGRGTLRLWRTGTWLVAEIRDRGRLSDPLTGRRRPDPFSPTGGRGVWMMHQLCDLVEMRNLTDGLVVRLHMALA